jgi:uncharacterized protein YqgQ
MNEEEVRELFKQALKAVKEERYATAEVVLEKALWEEKPVVLAFNGDL